jgi:hypothetical protein
MTTTSPIYVFIILGILVFFALHIKYQWKISEDFELYEMDIFSKQRLEELGELRQPMSFPYGSEVLANNKYVKAAAYENKNHDHHHDYIREMGLLPLVRQAGVLLRPPVGTVAEEYELFSPEGESNFRCHRDYRSFFMLLTHEAVEVELSPWGWEAGPVTEDGTLMDPPSRLISYRLEPGRTLLVPPYWWFRFRGLKEVSVVSNVGAGEGEEKGKPILLRFSYRTFMSVVATSIPKLY